jgi:hypothetical protein
MERETEPRIKVAPAGWTIIGSMGAILGIACLVGIIAVLALKESNTLADIALVMAIIAFIVQLVLSAIQNAITQTATRENQQLNYETSKILEEIKANAAANQSILARQFDTLLNALIRTGSTGPDQKTSADGDTDDESPTSRQEFLSRPLAWPTLRGFGTSPVPEEERVINEIRSWPDEDKGIGYAEILDTLSPGAIAMLERYARDEITSRENGYAVGLQMAGTPLAESNYGELSEAGLVEESDGMGRLTDLGRQVVRLLKAQDTPPPRLAQRLKIRPPVA